MVYNQGKHSQIKIVRSIPFIKTGFITTSMCTGLYYNHLLVKDLFQLPLPVTLQTACLDLVGYFLRMKDHRIS